MKLYGFDDFFKNLPDDLERLDFIKSNRGYYGRQQDGISFDIPLPDDISRFKNLSAYTWKESFHNFLNLSVI